MTNLELTVAKYIIVALLIIIVILVFVIFALNKQISQMMREKMQEEKNKKEQLLDAGERRRSPMDGFYDAPAAYRHFLFHVHPSAAAQGEGTP